MMIKETDAVSEVLGMMLLLSSMMIMISVIMLVGMPMIDSAKQTAKMDVAMSSFLSMQNDIEEVVRGPIWVTDPTNISNIYGIGPSRDTEFELMDGTLTEFPSSRNLTYTNSSGKYVLNISSGRIEYEAKDEFIIFENGAVIRKYESGAPLLVSDPLFNIYDTGKNYTVISIHAITLRGNMSSSGGEGKAWVETRLAFYNQTFEALNSQNSNQTDITIFSQYPEMWKVFLDEKLQRSGLTPSNQGDTTGYNISGIMPLEVQIYGKDSNRSELDILLSVYETGIDLDIR
jgi:hypothetical protein